MLLFNRTYNQYVRYDAGLRKADGLTTQVKTRKIIENFNALGYFQSVPSGYQSAAVATIPTIKRSGFMAARMGGEGTITSTLRAWGNLSATLQGEGTTTLNANLALSGSATLQGEGTFTPDLKALGHMAATMNAGAQPSAFDIAQETLGQVIESGVNLKDVLKILLSVSAGKTSITDFGGGNATVVFRDVNDNSDRVTAGMIGSERITVVIDPT